MATLTLNKSVPAAPAPSPSTPAPPAEPAVRQREARAAETVHAAWVERWPVVFGHPPKPLKLGVHHDIAAAMPELAADLLKLAIRRWTGSRRYLREMAKGGERFDLDGQPAGEISAEDRATASARYKTRRHKPSVR